MIIKKTLVVGPFQCNCSILICTDTKEAVVIDPGDEFSRIKEACEKEGINIKYAVNTHAHLDHIGAVKDLKKWSPKTKILLHKDDEEIYNNLPTQGEMFGMQYDAPPSVDRFITDTEEIKFGKVQCQVMHTPGHSPGGVCLHFKEGILGETPVLFSGDTLFKLSIGRTDLWGGDHRQLIGSIKDRLLTQDDQTLVHPGHGESTTIGLEAKENPFL